MLLRPLLRPVLRPLLRNLFALAPAKAVPDPDAPIRELFANGEPGWWWDISDFSTMFQDGGGTMPVTGPGQPVGLILDKRLGLKRGAELMPNGDFSAGDAGWTISGGSSAPWAIADGVASVAADPDSASRYLTRSNIMEAGRVYDAGFDILASNGVGGVRLMNSADNAGPFGLSVGRHRHLLRAAGSSPTALVIQANVGWAGSIDNVSVRELPGSHGSQVTATSRPILLQDDNGFFCWENDGIDDRLQTLPIDMMGTDKMTVWIGLAKHDGNSTRTVLASAITPPFNPGSVELSSATDSTRIDYYFRSGGTMYVDVASRPPPALGTAEVVTLIGDIGGRICTVQVNDDTANNDGNQGSGTYGNYPWYFGSRGNGSFSFRGRMYSSIGRGAYTPPGQRAPVQAWVNSKTGAY